MIFDDISQWVYIVNLNSLLISLLKDEIFTSRGRSLLYKLNEIFASEAYSNSRGWFMTKGLYKIKL